MTRKASAAALAAVVLLAPLVLCAADGNTFRDTFDKPLGKRWFVAQKDGDWVVENGKLFTRGQTLYSPRFLIARFPFTEGSVEFEGFGPETAKTTIAFSPVGKYIDGSNYWFLRAGLWGMSIKGAANGKRFHHKCGAFKMRKNERHTFKVLMKKGRAAIFVDGVALTIIKDPLAGRKGCAGVYASSQAKLDNFVVTRTK